MIVPSTASVVMALLVPSAMGQYVMVDYGSDITWQDADTHCATTYGTNLATIVSDEMAAAMMETAQNVQSHPIAWVGLSNQNSAADWSWSSGFPCDGTCESLDWWDTNEPSVTGDSCVYMNPGDGDINALLNDEDCTSSEVQYFFCDTHVFGNRVDAVESDVATIQSAVDTVESDVETVEERASATSWGQYVFVQEQMDWDDANDYCASTYGTTLATIKNDDDALTIYEMLEEYHYFWVGLRDRDEDGVHEWESGYPCDADCGTQWLLDDGTALVSDECVYVAGAATGYADILRDYPCDDSRFFFACDAPVLGNRMADVEGRVDTVESDVSTVNDEVDAVESDVATIQTAVDTVNDDVDSVESDVNDLESRVQSLENIISGFNDAIDSESASVAAPVGLIPFPDLALYALAAINVAVLLCLFVFCVTKRMEAPTYGKVVMYDTDRV